jgi:hypothetical protein
MTSRKNKSMIPLYRDLIIVMKGIVELLLGQIPIKCPLCGSWMVSTNGTNPRKDGRMEGWKYKGDYL